MLAIASYFRAKAIAAKAGPTATGSREFVLFFLACVVVAGVYGAMTVSRRIFFVQALPALVAIAAWQLG